MMNSPVVSKTRQKKIGYTIKLTQPAAEVEQRKDDGKQTLAHFTEVP